MVRNKRSIDLLHMINSRNLKRKKVVIEFCTKHTFETLKFFERCASTRHPKSVYRPILFLRMKANRYRRLLFICTFDLRGHLIFNSLSIFFHLYSNTCWGPVLLRRQNCARQKDQKDGDCKWIDARVIEKLASSATKGEFQYLTQQTITLKMYPLSAKILTKADGETKLTYRIS